MNRILVWDLPTRLLHWLFAAAVVAALTIALTADHDSGLFQVHMLLGVIAAFLVLLRLVWGVVGSRYARIGSFLFGPGALAGYLVGVFRRTAERHIGHNPGSAYAICAMLLLSLGLAVSGLSMSSSEAFGELHEALGFAMLAVVGAHIAGIVLHTLRHRENISLSMVHGRKAGAASQEIRSAHAIVGIVFLALAAGWVAVVLRGHDAQARRLTLLGQTFQLCESRREAKGEHEEHRGRRGKRRGERHHHEHRGHGHHDGDDD